MCRGLQYEGRCKHGQVPADKASQVGQTAAAHANDKGTAGRPGRFVDACYKTGKSPYATLRQFVLDYAYSGKAKTPTPTPEPVEVFWGM